MSLLVLVPLAVVLVASAILAVTVRNLVHAVLWLGVVLAGTAAAFVALDAPFLATVQVLLYIGGVVTLLIFGVMLTGRPAGAMVARESKRQPGAAVVSIGLFLVLATAILAAGEWPEPAAEGATTRDLAGILLGKDLLAFEAISLLLLAAMIGAIVLARPRDFGAPPPGKGSAP